MGDDRNGLGPFREVIYTSKATTPFTREQLVDLLDASRRSNEGRQITGMLMHADGVFLQLIEGPDIQIDRLMESIRADARHHDIRVISQRPIRRRSFPGWQMAFRDAPADHLAAFDPYFSRGGTLDRIESGLAKRLFGAFLALHE